MPTVIHERVRLAREGNCPAAICRMPSGFLLIGESQPVKGYCVLLADPVVPHLNAMDDERRSAFLRDMGRAGEVLMELLPAVRVNYEILGNVVPALHGHVIPRFADEAEDKRLLSMFCGYKMNELPPTDLVAERDLMHRISASLIGRGWATKI